MQPTVEHREALIYATLDGRLPWDPLSDPLAARTARVIAESEAEAKLALEAKKPDTIKVDKDAGDTEVPESLEIVTPDDDGFQRGGRH